MTPCHYFIHFLPHGKYIPQIYMYIFIAKRLLESCTILVLMSESHNPLSSSSGHLSPDFSPTVFLLLSDKPIPPLPSLLSSRLHCSPNGNIQLRLVFFFRCDCISQGDREDESSRGGMSITEQLMWFNMKF